VEEGRGEVGEGGGGPLYAMCKEEARLAVKAGTEEENLGA